MDRIFEKYHLLISGPSDFPGFQGIRDGTGNFLSKMFSMRPKRASFLQVAPPHLPPRNIHPTTHQSKL